MRTAIIITCHLRTFDACLDALHWHVFRHFHNPSFFVSTIADEDAGKAELLALKYRGAQIEVETVPEQPDCVAEVRAAGVHLPAEWMPGKPYTFEPYAISVHPQSVLRQLWQLERGWELFLRTGCKEDQGAFDVVVRCRPDLFFHAFRNPYTPGPREVLAPWWGQFGGINDRFAVMGLTAAESYFRTYANTVELMKAGCPLHPELLLASSIARSECYVRRVAADFSTLRKDGQMRAPEISMSDLVQALLPL